MGYWHDPEVQPRLHHKICFVCLDAYVESLGDRLVTLLAANEGHIPCRCRDCVRMLHPIDVALAQSHARRSTVRRFLATLGAAGLSDAATAASAAVDAAPHREEAPEEAVERHQHAIEEMQSLRCPHCRGAFYDFDGPLALICPRPECGAIFCAWCLREIGPTPADAYAHILTCEHSRSPGSVFAPTAQFDESVRRRRTLLTRAYVEEDVPRELRESVLLRVAPLIEDLGLRFDVAGEGNGRGEGEPGAERAGGVARVSAGGGVVESVVENGSLAGG